MEARERVVALSHAEAATVAAEREARRGAAYVAAFVGVPAAIAAGATIVLSALTAIVLLAPAVAVVLAWAAWRSGRAGPPTTRA
jgi:hypothetical protein